jgi:hypothetical protein
LLCSTRLSSWAKHENTRADNKKVKMIFFMVRDLVLGRLSGKWL